MPGVARSHLDVYGCLTQSSPNSNSSAQRSHEGFLAKPLTGCDNEARQAHAVKEGSQTTQFQSYFPFPLKGGRVGRRCQGPFGRHGQPYQGSLRRRPLPRLWSGSERLSAKGRGDCSPSDLRDWLRRMQQRRGSAPFSPVALEARFSSLTPWSPGYLHRVCFGRALASSSLSGVPLPSAVGAALGAHVGGDLAVWLKADVAARYRAGMGVASR